MNEIIGAGAFGLWLSKNRKAIQIIKFELNDQYWPELTKFALHNSQWYHSTNSRAGQKFWHFNQSFYKSQFGPVYKIITLARPNKLTNCVKFNLQHDPPKSTITHTQFLADMQFQWVFTNFGILLDILTFGIPLAYFR